MSYIPFIYFFYYFFFFIKSKKTYSKYICEVLPLNKLLHCGQSVVCNYSIVVTMLFTFRWHKAIEN